MTPELEKKIRAMAEPAKPSEFQIERLLQNWDDYFAALRIDVLCQEREFDSVIRARLSAAAISIQAPTSVVSGDREKRSAE